MSDNTSPRRPAMRYAAGLIAAGAVVGGIAAASLTATAATPSQNAAATNAATGDSGTASGTNTAPQGAPRTPDRSSTPVRTDEKAVSTDVAAKLKAAALKSVPGGTVYRVETDADGDAYEAHMVKADGTEVTVKFDKNYNVTSTQAGHGKGGPGGPGGAGAPGAANGQQPPTNG